MVVKARRRGMRFNCVGADGFYGENPGFCNSLDNMGEVFMVDVHKTQPVFLKCPRSDYKYSLSNAPEDISVEKLARMQGQRYWIERSFEDGKSAVGMGDYQVRGWRGWHHHMTVVMLAMLFMLKERMENNKSYYRKQKLIKK